MLHAARRLKPYSYPEEPRGALPSVPSRTINPGFRQIAQDGRSCAQVCRAMPICRQWREFKLAWESRLVRCTILRACEVLIACCKATRSSIPAHLDASWRVAVSRSRYVHGVPEQLEYWLVVYPTLNSSKCFRYLGIPAVLNGL